MLEMHAKTKDAADRNIGASNFFETCHPIRPFIPLHKIKYGSGGWINMRKMNNKSAASMLKITFVALLMVPTILAIPTSEPAVASPMINVSSGALTGSATARTIHPFACYHSRTWTYLSSGRCTHSWGWTIGYRQYQDHDIYSNEDTFRRLST